jgi:cytochrome P450
LKGRADPVLDELLRFATPVQRQRWRWATQDTVIRGRKVSRGESVVSLLGAANRDPDVFVRPDVIDFERPRKRHLTFGVGTHFCLGNHLAKLELNTALGLLSERLPDMRLAVPVEEIPWNQNFLLPGPAALPVAVA